MSKYYFIYISHQIDVQSRTLPVILTNVCKFLDLDEEAVKGKSRKMELVFARQIFAATAVELKHKTEPIGAVINCDHSTVSHAKKKVDEERVLNRLYCRFISEYYEFLKK